MYEYMSYNVQEHGPLRRFFFACSNLRRQIRCHHRLGAATSSHLMLRLLPRRMTAPSPSFLFSA